MRNLGRWIAGACGGALVLATLAYAQPSWAATPSTQLPSNQRPSTQLPGNQRPSTQLPSEQRLSLYDPSMLVLTIASGTRPDPVQRGVMLRCTPRGGDHPAPEAACAALESTHGDVAAIAGGERLCTMEYQPVTVTARGVWGGKITSYQATFGNRCELLRNTGSVFDF